MPKGVKYRGAIHEQVDSQFKGIQLPLVFDHDGYLQDGKGERNLAILLEQYKEDSKNPYTLYQISKTLWVLKRYEEADKYFKEFYGNSKNVTANYRKVGIVSYLYNLLELKKYDDGLELIEKEKNKFNSEPDFYFACGVYYMQTVLANVEKYMEYFFEIEKSFLKCLEIGENKYYEGVVGCGTFKASYNLGVFYEVTGNTAKAKEYYQLAQRQGYKQATERLKNL